MTMTSVEENLAYTGCRVSDEESLFFKQTLAIG